VVTGSSGRPGCGTHATEEPLMTDDTPDADLLLMELKVESQTGAVYGEKKPADGPSTTAIATVSGKPAPAWSSCAIQARKGSTFRASWSRRMAEKVQLCDEIDDKLKAFLARPIIEGNWPYLRIDATSESVRMAAVIVAVGAATATAGTPWPRCSSPPGSAAACTSMRNALVCAGKSGRRVFSAFIATAFAQDDAETAKAQWRRIAGHLRPKLPKLATFLDEAETDVLAYMTFPPQHLTKLRSTNPIERLNGEIMRRTDVDGIFPNEGAIVCLTGAILLVQNYECAVQRARCMTPETIAPLSDDPTVSLPATAG
jgi:putative transposase